MIDLAVATSILLLLAISLEIGFRLGHRATSDSQPVGGGQLGAIQGAMLGLLALLLGFNFSGAASRFLERQDLIVREANAIGTAYLRADILDEPHRSELKQSLVQYTVERISASATLREGLSQEVRGKISRMHERIWNAARAGVLNKPATTLAVLNPINDIIDFHATRLAASRKHIPMIVMALLIASSALSMATIGYGCGLGRRRLIMMTGPLALLIGVALWTTIDLDHPRGGLIRLSDAPLIELNLTAEPSSARPAR